MPFNRPVPLVVLREVDADGLAALLLEFRKACLAVKELLERCFRIRDGFLPRLRTAFVDSGKLVRIFQMVVHEFVKIHRREEMFLALIKAAALVHMIKALVPRDVFVVEPAADAEGTTDLVALLTRRKDLRLVTL